MRRSKFRKLVLISILAVVSFGIYVNSLEGDFLIDDTGGILRGERLHDLSEFFREHFQLTPGILGETGRAFIWHIWGDNPIPYHLSNVIAQVICVILIFILCNLLFKNTALSFFTSLIFALHPIHTEAVSWISGGPYVLAALFYLLSFIFYVKSDKSIFNLCLSVVAFVFCFLSGNLIVSLPLLFIVYDLFFRQKNHRLAAQRKIRLVVLIFLSLTAFVMLFKFFVLRNEFMHMIFYFRGLSYLVVVVKAFAYYIRILYMPTRLGLYHPFAFDTGGIQSFSPLFFISLIIILGLIVLFIYSRRRNKPIAFGLAWFFITYLPYSNIIPVCNIISERYLYLPSLGFSLIMSALILKAWNAVNNNLQYRKMLRIAVVSVVTLLLGSYANLTLKRNYQYSNIISYWHGNINNFSKGYMVYNNLAATFYKMGNYKNAIAYCWVNLMTNYKQPHVWCNLGKLYTETGDYARAKECYQKALELDSNYFPARKGLKGFSKDD